MTRDEFEIRVGKYLDRVRENALQLFDAGVMSEHALGLAQQIADSQETKNAMLRGMLAVGAQAPLIGRKN